MGDLEIFNLFQDNFDGNQPLLEWEAQIENYFDLVSLPLNVRNIKVVLFVVLHKVLFVMAYNSFISPHCTEVRFVSFLSGGFITLIVVNPPERKLAKRTFVHYVYLGT